MYPYSSSASFFIHHPSASGFGLLYVMFDLLSLAMGISNLAAPKHIQQSIPVFILEIFSVVLIVNARNLQPVDVHGRCDSLSFEEGYSTIWGRPNILEDGCTVQLTLDEHSGNI
eukprot:c26596_g2_i1 orf=467-808(+)